MQSRRAGDFDQCIEGEPCDLEGMAGGFDGACEELGVNFIKGGAQTDTTKPEGAVKLSAVRL